MNIRPNVDLERSFDRLKMSLLRAQDKLKGETEAYKYAMAYGLLSGSVQSFLLLTTDASYIELTNDASHELSETEKEIMAELDDRDDLKDVI